MMRLSPKVAFLALYTTLMLFVGTSAYTALGNWYFSGRLFSMERDHKIYVTDFVAFYSAARLGLSHAANIYDPAVQTASLNQAAHPVKPAVPIFVYYPPYFFSLVSPLALLNLEQAFMVWSAIGLACIAGSFYLLRKIASLDISTTVVAAILCMVAYPSWKSFWMGQTSFQVLLGLCAFFYLLRKRSHTLAGLVSAFALIKVQYAPMIVLSGMIVGRRKYFEGFWGGMVFLFFLSGVTVGLENVVNYPLAAIKLERLEAGGTLISSMQNFRSALAMSFGGESTLTLTISICAWLAASALVPLLWLRIGSWHSKCAITTLLLIAFSPHTHVPDYLASAIPCALLWQGDSKIDKSLALAFPAFSWLSFTPFLSAVFFEHLHMPPYFLWTLVVLMAHAARRAPEKPSADGAGKIN